MEAKVNHLNNQGEDPDPKEENPSRPLREDAEVDLETETRLVTQHQLHDTIQDHKHENENVRQQHNASCFDKDVITILY